MIAVSRLLKSCAMPPARRPTASIFCEWRSCSSSMQPLGQRIVALGHDRGQQQAAERAEREEREQQELRELDREGRERTDAHAGDRDRERRDHRDDRRRAARRRSAGPPSRRSGKNTNAIGTSRVANMPHSPNISCDPANSVEQQRDRFADARPRPRRSIGRRPTRRPAAPSPSRRASRAATTT